MKLGELLHSVTGTAGLPAEWLDREVRDITHDSRKAGPGSLFVAVRGFHSDGHQFIPQAVVQGAAGIISEKRDIHSLPPGTPVIVVDDTRRALALLSAAFYGHPSRRLKLIGITGTNGKTTTSYLARSVIEAAGGTAGLIGTIDYRIGGRVEPAPNTTPESIDLQRLLAEMAGLGAGHCVMEVSSHALALSRTAGCTFSVAAFTNLTQDHLDFHRSMDDYFQAKLLLFSGLSPDAWAVVNIDDPRGVEIIRRTRARVITTGFAQLANIRPAGAIRHGVSGLSFDALSPSGVVAVESPLLGRHNIYNMLTAIGVGAALGLDAAVISRGLKTMRQVPGRMEKVDEGQPFAVVVDYAHTEDALERLLEAVREVTAGSVITVFGCGGDRDRTKRPAMGDVAVRRSDVVIVTSDNPRTEDPRAIIAEIEAGMRHAGERLDRGSQRAGKGRTPYYVVPDRHEAVHAAVSMARPGDVVVLAGKGHETTQIIGAEKFHFDDREVAREAIARAAAGCGTRCAG